MERSIGLAVFIIGLSLIFPPKAFAYLDPATGSYIIQIILAAVIGGLFVIRQYFTRIKLFFHRVFSRKES